MDFLWSIIVFLIYVIAFMNPTTLILALVGIMLLNISDVMKKKQLTKRKNAEITGEYSYQMKTTYKIPRVFGFIFLIPLILYLFRCFPSLF